MKLLKISLNEYATLTAWLHEPGSELGNILEYPAMLVLPGGGFRFCSAREGEPVAMAYYAEGYQAFVLDYTTVTKKKDATIADPMNDVQLALSLIREHASEWALDPEKLAMIGFSGGSHLAAAVSTHGPHRPDLLLLGYPGILHSDLRALECPDIIESVDANTPATYMFVTRNDKVTPPRHALAFASALDQAGIDYELHIFKDGPHGLSLAKALTCGGEAGQVNPRFAQWFAMSVQWLKEQFGEFTIYGVNDGRYGRFHIDKKIGELMADEQAKALTLAAMPILSGIMEAHPDLLGMSLRAVSGFMPIDKEVLKELDKNLLALG